MDVGGLVDAELHTAQARFINHARQVLCGQNRARLGAGHEAAGAQHATQLADNAHHVGRGQNDVEIGPALFNASGQVLGAHVIGAGLRRQGLPIGAGEDHNFHLAARAARQRHNAAHLLVGVARVHTHAQMDFHRLVKLGGGGLLDERQAFAGRVALRAVYLLLQRTIALAVLCHACFSLWLSRGSPPSHGIC